SGCRVVGIPIRQLTSELDDVHWGRRWYREVLCDEVELWNGQSIDVTALKEMYQALKEHAKSRGDHVRSGDFHYGEMEMKRRGFRPLRRYFGLEAIYCLLSGYGTRPLRAGCWLMVVLLMTSLGYWWMSPGSFGSGWEALA